MAVTRRIQLGATARHRAHGPKLSEGRGIFTDAVHSCVQAERDGYDFVRCYDATDFMVPQAGNQPEYSDYAAGAGDWNAALTMEPVIAAAAAQTAGLRFFLGPIDSVRRAPVNIAQMALTLDHATQGRTVTVLSQGQANHMRQFGMARAGTKDKFFDAVQIVRRLTSTCDEFSYRGRVWQMDRASLRLPSFDPAVPPRLYVAGGAPESLELAGAYADGWYHRPPGMDRGDPGEFGSRVRLIRTTAVGGGREPDEIDIHLGINVVMTEDEQALPALLANPIVKWFAAVILPINTSMFRDWGMPHPYGYDYNYHRDCIPEWVGVDEFRRVTSAVPVEAVPKVMFVGTAEQVHAQIEPYLRYGVSEIAVSNQAAMCGAEFSAAASLAERRLNDLLREHEVTFAQ